MIASRCFVVLAFLLLPPFVGCGGGLSVAVGPAPPPPASESMGVPTADGFAEGSSKYPSPG